MKYFLITLAILGLTACGESLEGQRRGDFQSGYYVAQSSLESVNYPLIVLKMSDAATVSYQISHFADQTGNPIGFHFGDSNPNPDVRALTTSISMDTRGMSYSGIITAQGNSLRVRSAKANQAVRSEADLSRAEIIQDYILEPVSKARAIEVLNSLVIRTNVGRFSEQAEANCQGAFEMSCAQVYESQIP